MTEQVWQEALSEQPVVPHPGRDENWPSIPPLGSTLSVPLPLASGLTIPVPLDNGPSVPIPDLFF